MTQTSGRLDATMEGDAHRFTVVVPCRGRHDLVSEIVEALLALGCPTVLVDDGSDPPLPDAGHPLLDVVRQSALGAGPARNRGASHCRSEWVAFTDSDTMWTTATREHLDRLVATTPEGTWVCGETQLPPSEHTITATWMKHLADRGRPPPGTTDLPLATGLFLCRRQELTAVGGFLPSLSGCGGEDWELGQRARSAGYRIVFDPDWRAVNLDRPFTFARLLAREENFVRQRQALRDQGVDAPEWLSLRPPRWWDRMLRPLASATAVGTVDRLANLPDVHRSGTVVWPLLRATTSATVRRSARCDQVP